MTDFNIQQVKKKLEEDLKYAAEKNGDFKKDAEALLKKMKKSKLGDLDSSADSDAASKDDEEETEALAKMEADFNESLDNAVIEFATKEQQ